MADVNKLKSRLESIEIVEAVLPTRRSDGERSTGLESLAMELEQGNYDQAESRSATDISGLLEKDSFAGSAISELATSEVVSAQIAQFARAGFNFFKSTPSFQAKSLTDRRAGGGNGAVRRVVRSADNLLLETARLVVGFEHGVSDAQRRSVMTQFRLIPLKPLRFSSAEHCATDEPDVLDLCLRLMQDAAVSYAEPDFIEVVPQRLTPSDPEFASQWHHQNIQSPTAWDIVTGSPMKLSVVDNGFDTNHPDLNPDSDMSGWYRPTPDGDDAVLLTGLSSLPDGNHGTACAGMAAASGDNGQGGTGVGYTSNLSVVACLGDQVGTQLTLARAIAYAADPTLESNTAASGADVISCSLGPNGANWQMRQILSDAIDFVATNGRNGLGTPLFWACTNGNFPISADEVCSHPHTIAVGRSDQNDDDNGSGFGPELDFLAPGVDVWIPRSGGGYHQTTGTSFAAPCAAGVAALALARNASMTAQEVRELLRSTADKVGNLPYEGGKRNDIFGYGRINAFQAVQNA